MPALLKAMRPHQWVKNIFVLAALVFVLGERVGQGASIEPRVLLQVAFAVGAFCLGASAIYLVNDVMDVESDRQHPTKRNRPIAAGKVSIPTALAASVICVASAAWLSVLATPDEGHGSVTLVVIGYMAMNLLYSVRLKHVAILDAFIIAAGFILRVLAGGYAAEAPVSHWLVLCTLFLALFLAFCKRRAEMDLLGEDAGEHRANLREYTTGFLDQVAVVLAACAIITYTMYTVDEETAAKFGSDNDLVWTVPFVVFGLFRYMLLVQRHEGGGSPTKVLLGGDGVFLVNGLLYAATLSGILFSNAL